MSFVFVHAHKPPKPDQNTSIITKHKIMASKPQKHVLYPFELPKLEI